LVKKQTVALGWGELTKKSFTPNEDKKKPPWNCPHFQENEKKKKDG